MLKVIKSYAHKVFSDWSNHDTEAMLALLEKSESLVDLGCGDGKLTKLCAKKAKAKIIVGLDSLPVKNNFRIVKGNLNKKFPFKSNQFDAAISHYSLEHLYNTGMFISETKRILKRGGYTIVATDNLSNWPTILGLIFGFQPFSMACGIAKHAIGNPLAIRANFGEVVSDREIDLDWRISGEWSHNKVLAYQAIVDAYKEYGFEIEKIVGIGYFPFWGVLSKIFANIDKRHAYCIIIKARKT